MMPWRPLRRRAACVSTPNDTSYVPLSLDQAFENYLIAKRDHDRECDLARQNYGGWNFTASTRNKLTNAEQYLRWTFNR